MADDLPFRAEYSKSSRASCKRCKQKIEKDVLRLAVMCQSPVFDGKFPNWFHFECFFGPRRKIKSTAEFADFDSLRWEDQKKLEAKISGGGDQDDVPSSSGDGGKAKKRKKKDAGDVGDFCTEYAKSSRSTCRGCEQKIEKGLVRIAKNDYETDRAVMYGPQPLWYHVNCFIQARKELEFFDAAETLPGFYTLGAEDRQMLKDNLKKIKGNKNASAPKKPKSESTTDGVAKEQKLNPEESKMKEQNDLIFKYRDQLKSNLDKKELQELLEFNKQDIPPGESRILDALADCMTFGALQRCPECSGQFKYKSDGYHCTGNVTGWTSCLNVVKIPKRVPFKVPEEFHQYQFLEQYEYIKRTRILPPQAAESIGMKEAISKPLGSLKIGVLGHMKKSKDEMKSRIEELGGSLATSMKNASLIISTKEEVDKLGKRMMQAKSSNIHIVSEEFLDNIQPGKIGVTINQYKICSWGDDPQVKFQRLEVPEKNQASKSNVSGYTKNLPDKLKLTVKGAAAVDPDSDLADKAHVYEEKGSVYNVVLGMVDILKGINSYYKLQLLESDKRNRFWVFRSWGRVGTTIGGNKTEEFDTKHEAVIEFKRLYEEKTANIWENRNNFVKKPHAFYPLEIDYGQNEDVQNITALKPTSDSKLSKSVQELICLIFDVEIMKKTMLEFEIDMKKMPLGKLSKRQIESAYSVLTELQEQLKSGNHSKFLDASNRFYTLIPHDFGMKKPPMLDNEEIIKNKIEMLDSLLEIEVAYKLLKGIDTDSSDSLIDKHYKQLKTNIEVLDKEDEEFKHIEQYVSNTHASTHNQYMLKLEEVFKINRHGENKKYKPFKKLHNKKLLWHGSRLANFAGILSQGLRIAPPEAPVTGYMFGKGIYFADMVSKSANYCYTSKASPTGLLLLCEVALGNMYERLNADYITKLPTSKHSTKGVGRTAPDPSKTITTPDGVEIPLGPAVDTNTKGGTLLYNEYIVYDVAQVNIKYLLRVNFNWKF